MTISRSQIVATLGPATKDADLLVEMIKHQMDIVRLNFSHGTHEEHASHIKTIRSAAAKVGRKIPVIQDLSGPRVQEKESHHIAKNVKKVVTEKDINDLKFGLEQDIDYVVMSYVGGAEDVEELREQMTFLGKIKPIIAKVERQKGVDNIDKIIEVSNAIMIGRGDLGNEVPLEEIPFVEKMIIKKCKAVGKPVITATQMMISMVNSPIPTRAEVTDVVYAVMNGSDAVMLSEETAIGKYPLEVIKWMEKILIAAEKHLGKLDVHPLL